MDTSYADTPEVRCIPWPTLLILVTIGLLLARLFHPGPAVYGANDCSRWATIRSLVDEGTYVIGHREPGGEGTYQDAGIIADKSWDTIDKVLQPGTLNFFSSKPPLLSTIGAGIYWLIKAGLGISIVTNIWLVTRIVLSVLNVLPLLAYLVLLDRLLNAFRVTPWCRAFILTCACFGTFITTFSVTLNNHTLAAICVLAALCPAIKICRLPNATTGQFAAAGFFSGLTTAMELPAAAFTVGLGIVLARNYSRRTILIFVPAALVPISALLLTNWLAIGDIRPAYSKLHSPWYEFAGSYWKNGMGTGIDAAGLNEDKLDYALNLLIGHHGFFSLTPVFFLALGSSYVVPSSFVLGSGSICDKHAVATLAEDLRPVLRLAKRGTLLLSVIIFGFYIAFTSNYGGTTCGPRWFVWLTPLYLLSMIPAVERAGSSANMRLCACGLLLVSVFSSNYTAYNPWSDPWLYDVLHSWQVIQY